ncbi:hypothetical protein V7149_25515 [Bacillus sp. JJ1503]|uniref:hypothetical protein n=1 Tax=Bacillus sp. JJ1503 TaxID=3122956 RepID=UPI003000DE6F
MKFIDYYTLSEGERFTSKFIITEKLVMDYITALEDSYESEKVPKYLFAIFSPIYEAFGGRLSPGTIQIKQKMEHFQDAAIGDEINVIVTIKEKYKKIERNYLVYEVDFFKENELVCKHESTHIWDLLQET